VCVVPRCQTQEFLEAPTVAASDEAMSQPDATADGHDGGHEGDVVIEAEGDFGWDADKVRMWGWGAHITNRCNRIDVAKSIGGSRIHTALWLMVIEQKEVRLCRTHMACAIRC
jgi:hypothetical protein